MPNSPIATIVLDTEAVDVLGDKKHNKHRSTLAYIEAAASRRSRRPSLRVLVPVAVRIEAGWDRQDPACVTANRVTGADDVSLDGQLANRAVQLRKLTNVSVVDATVAAVVEAAPKPVAVLTSDMSDMDTLAGIVGGDVRVIQI